LGSIIWESSEEAEFSSKSALTATGALATVTSGFVILEIVTVSVALFPASSVATNSKEPFSENVCESALIVPSLIVA